MIYIGNQTSCWAPKLQPFEYAVANGFDAFEWFPDKKQGVGWDESDLDALQRQRIRETAAEKGIRLSVHARWQANPLRPESSELFLRDMELANDLGAALLNIHLSHEEEFDRYISAITPLIQATSQAALQLSIENTPEHSPEHFNELFSRFSELKSVSTEHVGMCLDLGHANLSGATRNDYLAFVDRLGAQVPIIHLHLHENWGDGDTHLTLFTGPAGRDDSGIRDFVKRMQKRKFSGSIIFEQWPQPPLLLNAARDRLRGLFAADIKTKAPEIQQSNAAAGKTGAVGSPMESPGQACQFGPGNAAKVGRGVPTAPRKVNNLDEKDFVDTLVAGDKHSRSWREKLEAIRELIVSREWDLNEEELTYIAIYLSFLSAGQIACIEDGHHFRPAHHARISQEIQQRLGTIAKPSNAHIIRQIYAALPSSAQAFRRAEPLTRIRDIAHRNDIPSELKREIKTSLQNKLHRCAGPEDLATSTALLERISAPGANYSSEFVEQFRIFHEELKEFFNARSLEEQLAPLAKEPSDEWADFIRAFLKQKLESGFENKFATLKTLTALRRLFAAIIQKDAGAATHEFVLADIGLEDFAFVLVSEMINAFESTEPRRSAMELLEPLGLVVGNLAMSGISAQECGAIGAELNAWRGNLDPADREQLLRLKATVERCRRLAECYSERVILMLLSKAERLGVALGVAQHAIRVFCEGEIRRHLVFQLSKLTSILLRRLREALNLPEWDILVGGEAQGWVKVLEQLDDLSANGAESMIVVLKKAEGDEEIPKAVKGILLAHQIPHLSHLGVRARQAGVIFAVTEESVNLEPLGQLHGQAVRLLATAEKVSWATVQEGQRTDVSDHAPRKEALRTKIQTMAWCERDPLVIPLTQISPERGGQKAFGLRKLAELAHEIEDEFSVPTALVIPFGVMEKALSSEKEAGAEYEKLAKELEILSVEAARSAESNWNDEATERVRRVIEQLEVSGEITSAVARHFQPNERLMVRSSANCEDLQDFAGAGLYESIPNVSLAEVGSAIRRVWSSLWTRRAVLSRKAAGISHEHAQMAVIVQQMLAPDYSFILHTVNPINRKTDEVYAEMAAGMGETLASAATRGTPYRLACNKKSGEVQTLAFANFSHSLRPGPNGNVVRELLDYSQARLSRDAAARQDFGRRLGAIAARVENAFGCAQDIEGAVVGLKIYLVQSRRQQGV